MKSNVSKKCMDWNKEQVHLSSKPDRMLLNSAMVEKLS